MPISEEFGKVIPELDFSEKRQIRTENPDGTPYILDDCYLFCKPDEFKEDMNKIRECGTLTYGGLALKFYTSAPSMHIYSGKWNLPYQEGRHGPFSGIAFEPERYVDAINWDGWKDLVILKPG